MVVKCKITQLTVFERRWVGVGVKFWMFAAAMSYKNWISADKGGGSNSGHFVIVIIECPIWESIC